MMEVLLKLGKKHSNIVFFGYNLGDLKKFFPDKCIDLGRASGNIVSCAAGFALRGKLPVIFADKEFLEGSFKQLKYDVCEPNLNIKIVVTDDINLSEELLKLLPNMKVNSHDVDVFDVYGPMCLSL